MPRTAQPGDVLLYYNVYYFVKEVDATRIKVINLSTIAPAVFYRTSFPLSSFKTLERIRDANVIKNYYKLSSKYLNKDTMKKNKTDSASNISITSSSTDMTSLESLSVGECFQSFDGNTYIITAEKNILIQLPTWTLVDKMTLPTNYVVKRKLNLVVV